MIWVYSSQWSIEVHKIKKENSKTLCLNTKLTWTFALPTMTGETDFRYIAVVTRWPNVPPRFDSPQVFFKAPNKGR